MSQYMIPGGPVIDVDTEDDQYMIPGYKLIDLSSDSPAPPATNVANSLMMMGQGI